MIKCHANLWMLLIAAVVDILGAAIIVAMLSAFLTHIGHPLPREASLPTGVLVYILFMSFQGYLVLRNGSWAIDEDYLYRGWSLRRFIPVSEIVAVRVGLPAGIEETLDGLPIVGGAAHARIRQKEQVVIFKLTDNRYFLWSFAGLKNKSDFLQFILNLPGCPRDFEIPADHASKLSTMKIGRIIHV